MAYCVTYYTKSPEGIETIPSNIILRRTHPVIWAANPLEIAKELKQTTVLMFWMEIPDYFVDEVNSWCEIED